MPWHFAVATAAPTVSRLTPPSELFSSGTPEPVISRFLPGQRFDLQATIRPDAGQSISEFEFLVDGQPITAKAGTRSLVSDSAKLNPDLPPGSAVVSVRGYIQEQVGLHALTIRAVQSDGQTATATGNFGIVGLHAGERPVRNIIFLLGDGMGTAHRTAARIMARGYAQGKARGRLAMDSFPYTGMVMTASLNSIVTDSAPGMSNYVTGNKAHNDQEGVWPDDTRDGFDNPRVEYLSEYLHRTRGMALGLITSADVADATPAANAVHTAKRNNGTGIVDQYLDDRHLTGLSVLMGGGRKWFLSNPSGIIRPQPENGSQRRGELDYVLPPDIVAGWGATQGKIDPERNLIADFAAAGFAYAPTFSELRDQLVARPDKLLGLFAWSSMNVALDKIAGRRGQSTVAVDYGFPDQPMLDEMTEAALTILARQPNGFFALIEGASIDKQAHLMDSERWLVDTLEFDRAVAVAKAFADRHPDTLVIVTADHECAGAAIIGASRLDDKSLRKSSGQGQTVLRKAVGLYDQAAFPTYTLASDGYPVTMDVDRRILIGYSANADRYEDWHGHLRPTRDGQHPFGDQPPLKTDPNNPSSRNSESGFLITGQIPGTTAAHTGTDVPLSAYGRGAHLFTGVMDNTEVFFKIMQAITGTSDSR